MTTDVIQDKRFDKLFDETLEGKWVAIAPDYTSIVASADSLSEVMDQLEDEEKQQVVYHHVLPHDVVYIPTWYEVLVHELLPATLYRSYSTPTLGRGHLISRLTPS